MRISDWSSDGCSSDCIVRHRRDRGRKSDIDQAASASIRGASRHCPIASRRTASIIWIGTELPSWRSVSFRVQGLMKSSGKPWRSEEHTSELQSLMRISSAVFCLNKTINEEHYRNRLYCDSMATQSILIQPTIL